MKKVSLTPAEYQQVYDFCEKIEQKQSKEGSRDHHNNDRGPRRLENAIVGKAGEFAATKMTGGIIDLKVWETGSRGVDQFEADIIDDAANPLDAQFKGLNLHVKTCMLKHAKMDVSGEVVPEKTASWTIDARDPLRNSTDDKDIIILMFAEGSQGKAYALGWVKAKDVSSWWRRCLSPHMSHKRAIYYPDIKPLINLF